MRISTRGRYAVRALLDLAAHFEKSPVPLKDVSERQNISPYYLEQLFVRMRRQGIVKSVRGPRGGYVLARHPDEISVGEVIRAVEGPIVVTKCVDSKKICPREKTCATRLLWEEVSKKVAGHLDSVSMGSLMRRTPQCRSGDEEKKISCPDTESKPRKPKQ